jgi:spermidine synthase
MWQTKLGTCIFVSPSGYKVYQNLFYRWLTLNSDALQTVINKRKPHKPVLHYLPALTLTARTIPPSLICLLGLGGAGIPLMLTKHSPNCILEVIDNSEEIIHIAKNYFNAGSLQNLKLIHKNAKDYIEETNQTYPHLIIDLYDAHCFPKECYNENFFSSCKDRLTPNGFLSINLANIKEQWPIFHIIQRLFKHTLAIPIKKSSNLVVIASNNGTKETFLNQLNTTTEIKKIIWVEQWGFVADFRR